MWPVIKQPATLWPDAGHATIPYYTHTKTKTGDCPLGNIGHVQLILEEEL